MNQNDRVISYNLVSPKLNSLEISGDFQKIPLTEIDFIDVMPAYFRNYGSFENNLLVRIRINKKYSFDNFGSVNSKEFGMLKSGSHEWINITNDNDNLVYSTSLKQIKVAERKNRILKDTLTIKMGKLEFKFTPKTQ